MTPESGMWALVLEGDLISRAVMALLLLLSVASWGLILGRYRALAQASTRSETFSQRLERPLDMAVVKQVVESSPYSPLRELAIEAYLLKKSETTPSTLVAKNRPVTQRLQHTQFLARLERALEARLLGEEKKLQKGLSLLATLASSSPFIGLLGTVLGVIDALAALGRAGGAHLAAVGPGIAAALVATALGLFVAIPALIAHNLLKSRAEGLGEEGRRFGLELLNLFDHEES
ncbi:MAG: MotA/TolQ/ExbB proton channel family protein [bacterium]|nr:MotA/TolQ/ExbB proton channel family protein [bacterium]